ncbi:ORF6C domain-containing protein [Staphylococcus simulans]|uniref:ORF6C domain-containing protein n=1 Tax=Staphylococcus simulans TaxID=1286 RepID=UPI001E4E728E|nr:ORF6C domain-containing protein [Staphylococcus simulans]MCD8916329.1 ORF6C domain-containing protein [Staphylococcus simulans]
MAKRKEELIFLQNHIKQTNEQGRQLEEILNKMLEMEDRVENHVSYVETMVEEIKKEVPITYEQQKELQSIVQTKSNEFTKEYYKNGIPVDERYQSELFKKKKGQFIRAMWTRLKEYFNVPRYTAIQKVDYDRTKQFLLMIAFKDFKLSELEDKASWNIPGLVEEVKG